MAYLMVGAAKVNIDSALYSLLFPDKTTCAGREAFCRAIALDNGQKQILFIAYYALDIPLSDGIRSQISAATGVPEENILITIAYNSIGISAQDTGFETDASAEVSSIYCRKYSNIQLATGIEAGTNALQNMRPAKCAYEKFKDFANINKNIEANAGLSEAKYGSERFCGQNSTIMKFVSKESDELIAVLICYNMELCDEWFSGGLKNQGKWCSCSIPAMLCTYVEKKLDSHVVVSWTGCMPHSADVPISCIHTPLDETTVKCSPWTASSLNFNSVASICGVDIIGCINHLNCYLERISIFDSRDE